MIRTIAALIMGLWFSSAAFAGEVQVKLTAQIIEGVIAAQGDLKKIAPAIESEADLKRYMPQFEEIAKKNGFRSFDEMDNAAFSIGVALGRLDSAGNYVSVKEHYETAMDEVKADKTLSESERAELLAAFAEAMKETPEVQFMENVNLVREYRERIFKSL